MPPGGYSVSALNHEGRRAVTGGQYRSGRVEGQLVWEFTSEILLFFNLDLDVLLRAPLMSGEDWRRRRSVTIKTDPIAAFNF